jgi:hypothetical protein
LPQFSERSSGADVLIFLQTTDLSGLLAALARAAPKVVVEVPLPARRGGGGNEANARRQLNGGESKLSFAELLFPGQAIGVFFPEPPPVFPESQAVHEERA